MSTERQKKDTAVEKVTFSAATLARIEQLALKGTHGCSRQEVIRTLVEDGIRSAIKDGFLKLS